MDDIKRYAEDIKTIRELMTRYDEQQIVKFWVFYLWGFVVIAGAIFNYVLYRTHGVAGVDALLRVWTPVIVIGGLGETLGWVLHARDSGIALLTRKSRRAFGGAIGVSVAIVLLLVDAVPSDIHAGTLLAVGGVPLLVYAELTFGALYIEGFFLLAGGLVLRILGFNSPELMLAVGIVVGVVVAIAGVHSRLIDSRGPSNGE